MSILLLLAVGGGLAFLLLIIGIIVSTRADKDLVKERIGNIREEDVRRLKEQQKTQTPLTDWLNRRVEGSSFAERTSKALARADIKMKPGEYVALHIISVFTVGLITWFIGGRSLLVGILGGIVGIFLPGMYVKRQQRKRLIRFNEQLPDMLNLMVNGLRAGYSTMQAMEAVSKELPPPICDEFRRVVQEMSLGITMETALENLLRRIPSDDLDLLITAINVQREVGGNLAEIMESISYTIRERVRIKGEIRVLTSQVMYSGRFLAMMPLFVVGILFLLNRQYIMEFFSSGICGYIALGLAGILIISGYFVMNKLGEIEI
ncbi:MAG: secretion system protein F [Anaerolineae bacterium]|nr:secretion system protein F [Anaerolineae bacterium]